MKRPDGAKCGRTTSKNDEEISFEDDEEISFDESCARTTAENVAAQQALDIGDREASANENAQQRGMRW